MIFIGLSHPSKTVSSSYCACTQKIIEVKPLSPSLFAYAEYIRKYHTWYLQYGAAVCMTVVSNYGGWAFLERTRKHREKVTCQMMATLNSRPGWQRWSEDAVGFVMLKYLHVCLYMCIYLSINLSINQSIYLYINQSIYQSIHLSIYLSIYPSIHLSIYLTNLSINQSIYLSIYLFIYLSS